MDKTKQPRKYSDMTQEELAKEIEEETAFANKQVPSDYDLKELADAKANIEKHIKEIARQKMVYEENIKWDKERIKESKKVIKHREDMNKTIEEFRQSRLSMVQTIQYIKDRLAENPNYFKESDNDSHHTPNGEENKKMENKTMTSGKTEIELRRKAQESAWEEHKMYLHDENSVDIGEN